MTIDELDAHHEEQAIERRSWSERAISHITEASYGTAAYELVAGKDKRYVGMGICPECGDALNRNHELSVEGADFYDCVYSLRHKFIFTGDNQ